MANVLTGSLGTLKSSLVQGLTWAMFTLLTLMFLNRFTCLMDFFMCRISPLIRLVGPPLASSVCEVKDQYNSMPIVKPLSSTTASWITTHACRGLIWFALTIASYIYEIPWTVGVFVAHIKFHWNELEFASHQCLATTATGATSNHTWRLGVIQPSSSPGCQYTRRSATGTRRDRRSRALSLRRCWHCGTVEVSAWVFINASLILKNNI